MPKRRRIWPFLGELSSGLSLRPLCALIQARKARLLISDVFASLFGIFHLLSFGLQLDPKFWFFPGLYNYAIVYVASIFGFEDLTVKFVHGCAVGRPSLSFRETSRSREYWRVLRGKLPCGAVAVLLITMTKRKAAGEDNKQVSSWLDAVSASMQISAH